MVKGVDSVQKALGTIHTQLQQVKSGMDTVGRAATYAFGAASLALGGFVRQGIAASNLGDVLRFNLEALSRNIAGLFTPEILRANRAIGDLVEWFRQLTDTQRENIVRFVEAAAAGLGLAMILPKIVGGLSALVKGYQAVTVALGVLGATTGGVLTILGLVVSLLGGLGAAATVGEKGIEGLFGGFGTLQQTITELIGQLTPVFTALMDVGKQVFEALKPLIGAILILFVEVAKAVGPLIVILGQALVPILEGLTNIVLVLASAINVNTIKWLAAIGAFAAMIAIVPRVIAAFTSIIAAFKALATAQVIQLALSGPKGWAILAAGAAAAAVAVWGVNKAFESVNAQMAKATGGAAKAATPGRGEAAMKVGGFEAIDEAYKRVFTAALKVTAGGQDVDVDAAQLGELQAIHLGVNRVEDAMRRHPVGLGGPDMAGGAVGPAAHADAMRMIRHPGGH